MQKKNKIKNNKNSFSRVGGVDTGSMQQMHQMIPSRQRQQINQAVGQAVTNAAINELSSVFNNKFK